MSLLAFTLILVSSIMHATWNFLQKRAGGGLPFIWLFTAIAAVVYLPIAIIIYFVTLPDISFKALGFLLGSVILHLTYFMVLQKGYKVGDLSLVYPVARGTGPMLATVAAIFIYHEHPTTAVLIGTVLIITSVFFLSGGYKIFRSKGAFIPVGYGLAVGVIISGYTLLDKGTVSVLLISPLLLDYFCTVGRLIILTPFIRGNWGQVKEEWRTHRLEAAGVGILNSLAYILVLTTMIFTPLSHVAPVREISILIGTFLGTRLLSEGYGLRRMIAAGAMVIGVVTIAISG
ncbi:EamA family transporter [Camelliibacillus cellulosilyticus]|uniref:EamA family transporter n=1 Tax=Camelliibacillus cellulosilyticus TaxID=2174486 RepID=A0ABV9GKG9_9BACL